MSGTSTSQSNKPVDSTSKQGSPWRWIPSLYFSQGIPYVIVMTMSVVMYKRLGISNTDIALYTSWLYLPWVIKPLWSPLVDITRTKRFWVVSMQFLLSFGLALVAFSVKGSQFFQMSLFLFWIMAFASATHDIAADGLYMLSLTKHEQAWWVGFRSTFYRTAMIVGSGLLVVLAGVLESKNGLPPAAVTVQAVAGAEPVRSIEPQAAVEAQSGPMEVIVQPTTTQIPLGMAADVNAVKDLITQAKAWNRQNKFAHEEQAPQKEEEQSWWTRLWTRLWTRNVSEPLGDWLKTQFPKKEPAVAAGGKGAGNIAVFHLSLSKPPRENEEVAVTFSRKLRGVEYVGFGKGDKGFVLVEGERFVFNSENWNKQAVAVVQLDPKLKKETTVAFLTAAGNIPLAWSITLFVVAGLFLAFSCWHSVMLPRPANDGPVISDKSLLRGFASTLGSFFQKPGIGLTIAFVLLYRFDEAQLVKVIPPFLLDAREAGGLALTTSQVGLVYGTFGILALTFGGIFGGFSAAKYGLKKMLPIMVASMYLPKLAFVYLSWMQPENFLLVCGAVAVEQFGYGFGFTAFMLYMLYFADGPHKTAHYAICTGFMALGMMIPGMWSGWVADLVGYQRFFVWVIFSALPGFTLAMLLKVDPEFGKKAKT
jgi:PAT family beta-lactamase induction signal transducer AmpG